MVSYRFVEWRDETGAVIGTTPSITLFIDRDKTLTAVYEQVVVPPPPPPPPKLPTIMTVAPIATGTILLIVATVTLPKS